MRLRTTTRPRAGEGEVGSERSSVLNRHTDSESACSIRSAAGNSTLFSRCTCRCRSRSNCAEFRHRDRVGRAAIVRRRVAARQLADDPHRVADFLMLPLHHSDRIRDRAERALRPSAAVAGCRELADVRKQHLLLLQHVLRQIARRPDRSRRRCAAAPDAARRAPPSSFARCRVDRRHRRPHVRVVRRHDEVDQPWNRPPCHVVVGVDRRRQGAPAREPRRPDRRPPRGTRRRASAGRRNRSRCRTVRTPRRRENRPRRFRRRFVVVICSFMTASVPDPE